MIIIYFCDSGGRAIKIKFCCVDERPKGSQDPRLCWHRGPIDALTADLEEVASATAFERSMPGKQSLAMLMALTKVSPVEKDWQKTVDTENLTVRTLNFAKYGIETA